MAGTHNAMPRNLALVIVVLFSFSAASAQAQRESHMFELEHRQAESVIPQLQRLYGGDEVNFSPDGQKLMVRATAEQLAEIDQLLRRLDEAPSQVRLNLRHRDLRSSDAEKRSSRVISTHRESQQSITVQDGEVARISSGAVRRLPVALRGGTDPAALLEEVDMSSGFLVRPSVISPQQVELQITAVRNEPVAGMPDYETAGVMTIRRVSPGEWVELGEEREQIQTREGSRVYRTGGNRENNRLWEIQVEVEGTH